MFELSAHGTDVHVGTGPQYPWGGLYGGQIVLRMGAEELATDDARDRLAAAANQRAASVKLASVPAPSA